MNKFHWNMNVIIIETHFSIFGDRTLCWRRHPNRKIGRETKILKFHWKLKAIMNVSDILFCDTYALYIHIHICRLHELDSIFNIPKSMWKWKWMQFHFGCDHLLIDYYYIQKRNVQLGIHSNTENIIEHRASRCMMFWRRRHVSFQRGKPNQCLDVLIKWNDHWTFFPLWMFIEWLIRMLDSFVRLFTTFTKCNINF